MRSFLLSITFCLAASQIGFAGDTTDTALIGKWNLFKIIDNMTGNEVMPTAPNENFKFFIEFENEVEVDFNMVANLCENGYSIVGLHQIKFLFFDECTKICCESPDVTALLTYSECTQYFVMDDKTLVLVSEERIFYFSRAID